MKNRFGYIKNEGVCLIISEYDKTFKIRDRGNNLRTVPKENVEEIPNPLCHRCEYRVSFLEQYYITRSGDAPKAECKMIDTAKHSCYMFKPAEPLTLEISDSEKRLQEEENIHRPIGGILGARFNSSLNQEKIKTEGLYLDSERFILLNTVEDKTRFIKNS